MKSHFVRLILSFTISISLARADQTEVFPSRREFTKQMNSITEGMTKAEVIKILGAPPDKRTEEDPIDFQRTDTKEIWRYGTSIHLAPATLGQVYFDQSDLVQDIYGKGEPPADGMFDESELRLILQKLGNIKSYKDWDTFNPRPLIESVNLLQPLGKEKALAAITEFLRVTPTWDDPAREGIFLVLRTLFDVPGKRGYMPRMMIGAMLPEPQNPFLFPRFPLALVDDIPFLLPIGILLGGVPESPEQHMRFFRKHGVIRSKQLQPPDNPFATYRKFANSPGWIQIFERDEDLLSRDGRFRNLLLEPREPIGIGWQILRLVDTVHSNDWENDYLDFRDDGKSAKQALINAAKLSIRWSKDENKYVFLNGKSLPSKLPLTYKRHFLRCEIGKNKIQVKVTRISPQIVEISFENEWNPTLESKPKLTCRVYGLMGELLLDFESQENTISTYTSTTIDHASQKVVERLRLAADSEIKITISSKDMLEQARSFKP